MSYRIPLRKLSHEDVEEHVQKIISALQDEPSYAEVCRRAQEMGVSVVLTLCDTYTPEKVSSYTRPSDRETITYGYSAQLRADVVRDGYLLFVQNESGTYDQLSTSETVVNSPDVMFVPKLQFYEYGDLAMVQSFPEFLEEFLDRLEEGEGKTSLFRIDDPLTKGDVLPDLRPVSLDSLSAEDRVVELLPGAFGGTYLGENSLFFDERAFFPFAVAAEALHFGFYVPHGVSVLEGENLDAFCETLRQLAGSVGRTVSRLPEDFFSAMLEAQLYSVEPSEDEKQWLTDLVFRDRETFCETCTTLADWLAERGGESGGVSVLWP